MSGWVPWGKRIDDLAAAHPDRPAITFVPRSGAHRRVSWDELAKESNRAARLLADQGVGENTLVVIALPNSVEHFVLSIAVWKLGGCVLPLNPALPSWERDQILEIAKPVLVISDLARWADRSADPLPVRIATPAGAVASGGSTGRPKIILQPGKRGGDPDVLPPPQRATDFHPGDVQLVGGPMFHGGPFGWAHFGLFYDQTLVLLEKFEASAWVDAMERYRAQFAFLVPAMMRRIADVPDLAQRDFSSIRSIAHGGAPCAPWLKRVWVDLLGKRLHEGYGAIEGIGNVIIDGDEWLAHPGSVGRGFETDVRILDEEQRELPRGTVGEIYLRQHGRSGQAFQYLGAAPARTTPDGFVTVGDMGWVDADGYLFIADRRSDLIISGGSNVYPAEVEAALGDHPAIRDLVVIGLPDDRWGQRVHAIVVLARPVTPDELASYVRGRLAPYKVPKTYEFVDALPRNEAGKIRRRALIEERTGQPS